MEILKFLKSIYRTETIPVDDKWDLPVDWRNVSIDDMKFIFYQAEKQLDDSIKAIDEIIKKTITILTICLGILVTQTAFFVTQLDKKEVSSQILLTAGIGIVYLFISALVLSINLSPTKYRMMGSMPSKIVDRKLFDGTYEQNIRLIYLYRQEIINYNLGAICNINVGIKKSNRLNISIFSLLLYPLFLCGFYFLSR